MFLESQRLLNRLVRVEQTGQAVINADTFRIDGELSMDGLHFLENDQNDSSEFISSFKIVCAELVAVMRDLFNGMESKQAIKLGIPFQGSFPIFERSHLFQNVDDIFQPIGHLTLW